MSALHDICDTCNCGLHVFSGWFLTLIRAVGILLPAVVSMGAMKVVGAAQREGPVAKVGPSL